jgi:predicted metal-dependent phosphoesterase TrpH
LDFEQGLAAMSYVRTAMHVHSTWSYDGHWSLPKLARLYGALGVRAVLMTEHDTGFAPASFADYRAACAAASTSRCVLIPGIEYSSPDNDIHVLTWGLQTFLAEHRPVSETLAAVRDQGGAAVLAHPVRREAWRVFDPDWTLYLAGIELWNRKADGVSWGEEALGLIRQTGLPATVGQDFHRWRHLYPLTQVFQLEDEPNREHMEEALLAALKQGLTEPQAFRRGILNDLKQPGPIVHPALEVVRRRVRDTVRKRL